MDLPVPETAAPGLTLGPEDSDERFEAWLERVAEFEGRALSDDERMYAAEIATAAVRSVFRDRLSEGRWHYFRFAAARGAGKHVVTDVLLPLVDMLAGENMLARWWWLHKPDLNGSHFRLRILSCPGRGMDVERGVTDRLRRDLGVTVSLPVYEPEIGLFGGVHGIELVHEFFSRDSDFLARWMKLEGGDTADRRARLGLSVLLLRHLMNHAGLDVFEQWDVWERVWEKRQASRDELDLEAAVPWAEKLLAADTNSLCDMFKGEKRERVREFTDYLAEFGTNLCRAHLNGKLECGLRHFLATAILFHWSRLEFHYFAQARVSRVMADCTDPRT